MDILLSNVVHLCIKEEDVIVVWNKKSKQTQKRVQISICLLSLPSYMESHWPVGNQWMVVDQLAQTLPCFLPPKCQPPSFIIEHDIKY